MRRLTVWVDCDDEDVERVKEKLKSSLKSENVVYTIPPAGRGNPWREWS